METLDDQLHTNTAESTQPRAFTASELVACPACSRPNPPTRANCLYCGAELGISILAIPPPATKTVAEVEGEEVVHVVAVAARPDDAKVNEIAQLVDLAPSELNSLLNGRVTPLCATTSTTAAEDISDKLRRAGIEPVTISEEELNPGAPPKPIAALAIENDALTASVRRSGEKVSVPWNDVVLIVSGRLYFTTREVEQTRDKSMQVLDERHFTTDDAVLDIYSRGDQTGWRIRAGSFDFSCLGRQKKPIAFENFRTLAGLLQRSAMYAVFDEGYLRMRTALNKVWPLESRTGATEKRRTPAGEISATAIVSDNELQFTRYSRLLQFLAPQPQDDAQQS